MESDLLGIKTVIFCDRDSDSMIVNEDDDGSFQSEPEIINGNGNDQEVICRQSELVEEEEENNENDNNDNNDNEDEVKLYCLLTFNPPFSPRWVVQFVWKCGQIPVDIVCVPCGVATCLAGNALTDGSPVVV